MARQDPSASAAELLQHLEPSDPTTRAALKAALFDDDPFVQVTAIGLCVESGDVSRKLFLLLLKDGDADVREAAGTALIASVASGTPREREYLMRAMIDAGDGALPSVLAGLLDEAMNEVASMAIILFPRPRVLDALGMFLADPERPLVVRIELAEAMRFAIGTEPVRKELTSLYNSLPNPNRTDPKRGFRPADKVRQIENRSYIKKGGYHYVLFSYRPGLERKSECPSGCPLTVSLIETVVRHIDRRPEGPLRQDLLRFLASIVPHAPFGNASYVGAYNPMVKEHFYAQLMNSKERAVRFFALAFLGAVHRPRAPLDSGDGTSFTRVAKGLLVGALEEDDEPYREEALRSLLQLQICPRLEEADISTVGALIDAKDTGSEVKRMAAACVSEAEKQRERFARTSKKRQKRVSRSIRRAKVPLDLRDNDNRACARKSLEQLQDEIYDLTTTKVYTDFLTWSPLCFYGKDRSKRERSDRIFDAIPRWAAEKEGRPYKPSKPDPRSVRNDAAFLPLRCLGLKKGEEALQTLNDYIDDENCQVRENVDIALAQRPYREVKDLLLDMLNGRDCATVKRSLRLIGYVLNRSETTTEEKAELADNLEAAAELRTCEWAPESASVLHKVVQRKMQEGD